MEISDKRAEIAVIGLGNAGLPWLQSSPTEAWLSWGWT